LRTGGRVLELRGGTGHQSKDYLVIGSSKIAAMSCESW
jgi:hypothetical protein